MIKRAIHTAALFAVLVLAGACRQDDWLETPPDPCGSYVALRFHADITDPETHSVATRAVDPDGGGVRDITLFCFDNFGLFITTASAEVASDGSLTGDFTASVPRHTRRAHFVANQNMTDFAESSFVNKSESEVMAMLEGSAGQMIYWSRFACKPDPVDGSNPTTIADQLEAAGGEITMLRNHALVTVDNPTGNGAIEITGLAACNIQAFGTVAPYHPEKGFDFTLDEWRNADFVTIPQRDAKQSDIMDVTKNTSQYIFEHENRSDDPVSIILRGHDPGKTGNDLYYRVMLVDAEGNFVPVRRNYRYTLHINGPLSFGQSTFEAALTAAATNNVWVSISDNVNEVEDNDYILGVDRTFVVIDEDDIATQKSVTLGYFVKSKNDATDITADDKPEITWIDNSVAAQAISGEFTVGAKGDEGRGTIIIAPRAMGSSERLEGTLLVKHGRLQRKIRIVMIRKQTFAPSWVGTAIYGSLDADKKNRPHVNLMFTIPETCPEELFPMNVYISASELDVRNASGMMLSVVRAGDAEWYDSGDIGGTGTLFPDAQTPDYKFVYTVERSGVQRIYLENILSQENGYRGNIYIEAPHFETIRRTYTFTDASNAITISNLKAYSAVSGGDGGARDEYVYYYLVAQKAGAPVQFDMQLRKRINDGTGDDALGDAINAQEKDEFLFYSKNLTNLNADDPNENTDLDCYFSRFNDKASAWQQRQNPEGGRMLMFKPINPDNPSQGTGKYRLKMYTNCARSAEVVRIASNLNNQPAVSESDPDDRGDDGKYGGYVYRSQTFELANYNPFRFGARVRYDGGEWAGAAEEPDRTDTDADIPEKVTPLIWSFEPEKEVDIAIDVTSFKGSDGTSVDPFGRVFEIYIDAPMLKIDDARLAGNNLDGNKLKADPAVPGRFIYTVEADRAAERAYGKGAAQNADTAAAGGQDGERKILPFRVNSVASAGDIVISSNEEQIIYYDKTFRVTNESIKGKIVYEAEDAGGATKFVDVEADMFVAFERVTNSNRIGSVTMTADGEFELRLRKEYPLNWYGYPVAFHFEHEDHIHHARYASLAEMFAALQRGETVKLEREPLK